MRRRSFNRNQIDIEDQGRTRRDDAARTVIAIGKIRGNDEPAALADLHSRNTLVPTLDDRARAKRKFERPAGIARTIELLALVVGCGRLVQPPGVLHDAICPPATAAPVPSFSVTDCNAVTALAGAAGAAGALPGGAPDLPVQAASSTNTRRPVFEMLIDAMNGILKDFSAAVSTGGAQQHGAQLSLIHI